MGKISIHELVRVADYLEAIKDSLRTAYGNIRDKLIDSIVIAFTAALCGYEDYEELEEFGRVKLDFFKGFLGLPNGIPDESAFWRVLQSLKPKEVQAGLEAWLVDVKTQREGEREVVRQVNREGKQRRRSGFQVVSGWIGEGSGRKMLFTK